MRTSVISLGRVRVPPAAHVVIADRLLLIMHAPRTVVDLRVAVRWKRAAVPPSPPYASAHAEHANIGARTDFPRTVRARDFCLCFPARCRLVGFLQFPAKGPQYAASRARTDGCNQLSSRTLLAPWVRRSRCRRRGHLSNGHAATTPGVGTGAILPAWTLPRPVRAASLPPQPAQRGWTRTRRRRTPACSRVVGRRRTRGARGRFAASRWQVRPHRRSITVHTRRRPTHARLRCPDVLCLAAGSPSVGGAPQIAHEARAAGALRARSLSDGVHRWAIVARAPRMATRLPWRALQGAGGGAVGRRRPVKHALCFGGWSCLSRSDPRAAINRVLLRVPRYRSVGVRGF